MRINPLFFIFYLIFSSCGDQKDIYAVKGTVWSIEHESNEITIAHDTIRDLMMPMVMPFLVLDKKELKDLNIGDSVHFEFVWGDSKPFARKFNILGKGTIPEKDNFFDDEFTEIQIGNVIEDVTLLDLDSSKVNLSDSDGRYRFISYIFTRCPMPNMCPAVVMKNKYLVQQFTGNEPIDFIMVSFDHKYDTPSVLERYYGSSIEGYDNWKVWSSSGRIEDIYRLVKQSGGDFWGVEQERIGHSMSSVLIDPNREVLASWKGEKWKEVQVKNAIKLLMK
tara:strand:+ start:1543 stop:2376 length:834 start_codon:yes stop_codon:yes gene_type:complete